MYESVVAKQSTALFCSPRQVLASDFLCTFCLQVYTNIRRFRDDLASYPPDYFVCVPLLLDTLYNRVS